MFFQGNEKYNCATYLRLSRSDGDQQESNSIKNQRALLNDYMGKHPELHKFDEYVDDGYSGTNFERPDFKRMMQDIEKRNVNCIIVKDLSRFGRNYIETGRYLERIFPFMGVRFIAINDHYDSAEENDDKGRILIPFNNLINDTYCRDISLRVRSHLDVKRKEGQFIGSFAGYGYRKDPKDKNHLIIDEYAAGIVQEIFKQKLNGMSSQRIASHLNELGVLPPNEYKRANGFNYTCGFQAGLNQKWTVVSVNRILKNESYTGTLIQGKRRKINYKVKKSHDVGSENWIRVEDAHDAIISKGEFQQVQQLLELDTRTAPSQTTVYPLSGFLRCADCGQNMIRRTVTKNGKKYQYYHCSTYKNGGGCTPHMINSEKLTESVLAAIRHQVTLLVEAEKVLSNAELASGEQIGIKILDSQITALEAELERYSNLKITNRQNHFEEGTLTHRQAKYGYALSEDRRNLVLNPESAQVVKLIFQMYLEDMKIPEIARALEAQGVPSPQIQMAKKKRSRTKIKWPDSTIRSILKNPLYIGKCTLTLAKAKRELEVPAIVSKTEFQKAQKKLESTRLPSRKKARKKPNLLFKKIYDKESGKGLLCRTSEDESQQIYSFDKGYRCFSGKAPFIESEKIFREILSALEKEKMQAARIDRVLDLNPEKVKQCMDAGLLQYRKRANEIVAHLMAKDDERTAVYRKYEQGLISLEQVEEYEHQYQVAVQKQETAFKKVMLAVNDIEKAFSHGNPWLMKFRAISIPETLERAHLKEWLDHVWIVDFEQVEVILQESEWKRFFPEEWLNNGEEDCNGKKE